MKEGFQPTAEQKKILNAKGRVIKINARAGTGKTTTLRLIAEKNPHQKILYLVFNKKNKEDAKIAFPGNVTVHTVHSFANSSLYKIGKRYDVDRGFSACKFLPDFERERDRQVLATLAYNFLMFFLNSPFEKLEDGIDPYCEGHLNDEQRKIFASRQDRIVEATRQLSTSWNTGEKPCPDDFYLKMSHVEKTFQKQLETFDLILVDEGQDLSPVMLDTLLHCTKRIVLVGDTHQGIYGFRYAVDAMRLLNADQAFDLSLSFRFGKKIAELAACFIREAKGENHFRLLGNNAVESTASFYADLSPLNRGKQTAILSRTNLGLFKNAMFLRSKGWPYRFERDIRKDLHKILDVYQLHHGEREKIRDDLIQSFDSLDHLDKYAEKMEDFRLANMSQVVKQYAPEFPGAIFEMINLTDGNRNRHEGDAVVLSTVHAAKGQEYESVIIDSDIAEAISRTAEKDAKQFYDEANVAYVCLTRVKEQLLLPMAMKTILTPTWQGYMDSLVPKTVPKKNRGMIDRERLKTTPPKSQSSNPSSDPVQHKYKVGERVKTSNGYGMIISIEGEWCIIALEGQSIKLHERITFLNRYNRR